eukprot:COSAG03_NODE_18000_length_364_cov_0.475472_1_plen_81_part_01
MRPGRQAGLLTCVVGLARSCWRNIRRLPLEESSKGKQAEGRCCWPLCGAVCARASPRVCVPWQFGQGGGGAACSGGPFEGE